jgi:hypothetical protein
LRRQEGRYHDAAAAGLRGQRPSPRTSQITHSLVPGSFVTAGMAADETGLAHQRSHTRPWSFEHPHRDARRGTVLVVTLVGLAVCSSTAAVSVTCGGRGQCLRPHGARPTRRNGVAADLLALAGRQLPSGMDVDTRAGAIGCGAGRNPGAVPLNLLLRGGAGDDSAAAELKDAERDADTTKDSAPKRRGRPRGAASPRGGRGGARSASKRSASVQQETETSGGGGTGAAAGNSDAGGTGAEKSGKVEETQETQEAATHAAVAAPAPHAAEQTHGGSEAETNVNYPGAREDEELQQRQTVISPQYMHSPPQARMPAPPTMGGAMSPMQSIPGLHSPGTGNTLLPGEVDLPAELQMPPSMQVGL